MWVPIAFAATHPWIQGSRRRRRRWSWLSGMAKWELEKAPNFGFWSLGLWLLISYCHFGRTTEGFWFWFCAQNLKCNWVVIVGVVFLFRFGATFEWAKSLVWWEKSQWRCHTFFLGQWWPGVGDDHELIADSHLLIHFKAFNRYFVLLISVKNNLLIRSFINIIILFLYFVIGCPLWSIYLMVIKFISHVIVFCEFTTSNGIYYILINC